MILHAGLIATRRGGRWRGALIEGASGAGKSDLALRAIDSGWRLVADDRTLLFVSGGRLFGRAPAPLAGLLEARALDIVSLPHLPFAEVALAVRCAGRDEPPSRLPPAGAARMLALEVPRIALRALDASAVALLALAMERLGGGRQGE